MKRGKWRTAVNEQIRAKASDNVIIFDAFSLLASEHNLLNPDFAEDELHLSVSGYKQLNAELVQLLDVQQFAP